MNIVFYPREQPFDPPSNAPCSHAEGIFKEYLKFSFEVHGLLPAATVVSIESLITDPNGSRTLHTYIHTYIHTYMILSIYRYKYLSIYIYTCCIYIHLHTHKNLLSVYIHTYIHSTSMQQVHPPRKSSIHTLTSINILLCFLLAVIKRILKRIRYPDNNFDMGKLSVTEKDFTLEHTYNATQHRPMLSETRLGSHIHSSHTYITFLYILCLHL